MIVYAGMFVSFRGRKMTRYRERGFTLVELMIVIVVIGILAAIAAPNYQSFMAQRRLNGAARQIMSDLMAARMQAVSQNRSIKVSFPTTAGGTYTYDADDTNSPTYAVKNIQTAYGYYDVTVLATNNIIFLSNGTASPSGCGTATVTNAIGSRDIKVSSAGRVRIDATSP